MDHYFNSIAKHLTDGSGGQGGGGQGRGGQGGNHGMANGNANPASRSGSMNVGMMVNQMGQQGGGQMGQMGQQMGQQQRGQMQGNMMQGGGMPGPGPGSRPGSVPMQQAMAMQQQQQQHQGGQGNMMQSGLPGPLQGMGGSRQGSMGGSRQNSIGMQQGMGNNAMGGPSRSSTASTPASHGHSQQQQHQQQQQQQQLQQRQQQMMQQQQQQQMMQQQQQQQSRSSITSINNPYTSKELLSMLDDDIHETNQARGMNNGPQNQNQPNQPQNQQHLAMIQMMNQQKQQQAQRQQQLQAQIQQQQGQMNQQGQSQTSQQQQGQMNQQAQSQMSQHQQGQMNQQGQGQMNQRGQQQGSNQMNQPGPQQASNQMTQQQQQISNFLQLHGHQLTQQQRLSLQQQLVALQQQTGSSGMTSSGSGSGGQGANQMGSSNMNQASSSNSNMGQQLQQQGGNSVNDLNNAAAMAAMAAAMNPVDPNNPAASMDDLMLRQREQLRHLQGMLKGATAGAGGDPKAAAVLQAQHQRQLNTMLQQQMAQQQAQSQQGGGGQGQSGGGQHQRQPSASSVVLQQMIAQQMQQQMGGQQGQMASAMNQMGGQQGQGGGSNAAAMMALQQQQQQAQKQQQQQPASREESISPVPIGSSKPSPHPTQSSAQPKQGQPQATASSGPSPSDSSGQSPPAPSSSTAAASSGGAAPAPGRATTRVVPVSISPFEVDFPSGDTNGGGVSDAALIYTKYAIQSILASLNERAKTKEGGVSREYTARDLSTCLGAWDLSVPNSSGGNKRQKLEDGSSNADISDGNAETAFQFYHERSCPILLDAKQDSSPIPPCVEDFGSVDEVANNDLPVVAGAVVFTYGSDSKFTGGVGEEGVLTKAIVEFFYDEDAVSPDSNEDALVEAEERMFARVDPSEDRAGSLIQAALYALSPPPSSASAASDKDSAKSTSSSDDGIYIPTIWSGNTDRVYQYCLLGNFDDNGKERASKRLCVAIQKKKKEEGLCPTGASSGDKGPAKGVCRITLTLSPQSVNAKKKQMAKEIEMRMDFHSSSEAHRKIRKSLRILRPPKLTTVSSNDVQPLGKRRRQALRRRSVTQLIDHTMIVVGVRCNHELLLDADEVGKIYVNGSLVVDCSLPAKADALPAHTLFGVDFTLPSSSSSSPGRGISTSSVLPSKHEMEREYGALLVDALIAGQVDADVGGKLLGRLITGNTEQSNDFMDDDDMGYHDQLPRTENCCSIKFDDITRPCLESIVLSSSIADPVGIGAKAVGTKFRLGYGKEAFPCEAGTNDEYRLPRILGAHKVAVTVPRRARDVLHRGAYLPIDKMAKFLWEGASRRPSSSSWDGDHDDPMRAAGAIEGAIQLLRKSGCKDVEPSKIRFVPRMKLEPVGVDGATSVSKLRCWYDSDSGSYYVSDALLITEKGEGGDEPGSAASASAMKESKPETAKQPKVEPPARDERDSTSKEHLGETESKVHDRDAKDQTSEGGATDGMDIEPKAVDDGDEDAIDKAEGTDAKADDNTQMSTDGTVNETADKTPISDEKPANESAVATDEAKEDADTSPAKTDEASSDSHAKPQDEKPAIKSVASADEAKDEAVDASAQPDDVAKDTQATPNSDEKPTSESAADVGAKEEAADEPTKQDEVASDSEAKPISDQQPVDTAMAVDESTKDAADESPKRPDEAANDSEAKPPISDEQPAAGSTAVEESIVKDEAAAEPAKPDEVPIDSQNMPSIDEKPDTEAVGTTEGNKEAADAPTKPDESANDAQPIGDEKSSNEPMVVDEGNTAAAPSAPAPTEPNEVAKDTQCEKKTVESSEKEDGRPKEATSPDDAAYLLAFYIAKEHPDAMVLERFVSCHRS